MNDFSFLGCDVKEIYFLNDFATENFIFSKRVLPSVTDFFLGEKVTKTHLGTHGP